MQAMVDAEPTAAFGVWLLQQQSRGGLIEMLAKAAAGDRKFPRQGSPADVHARLILLQADGDMFEALEDAELAWGAG